MLEVLRFYTFTFLTINLNDDSYCESFFLSWILLPSTLLSFGRNSKKKQPLKQFRLSNIALITQTLTFQVLVFTLQLNNSRIRSVNTIKKPRSFLVFKAEQRNGKGKKKKEEKGREQSPGPRVLLKTSCSVN